MDIRPAVFSSHNQLRVVAFLIDRIHSLAGSAHLHFRYSGPFFFIESETLQAHFLILPFSPIIQSFSEYQVAI